jgi:hypothetical protein
VLTKTPKVIAAGVLAAVVGIGSAAPAAADSNSAMFVRTLANNGEDVSTTEIQLAVVDLGYAICNHLDTTQDPNATVNYMMSLGHSRANANMRLSASVINLCPELNHLTGY